MRNSLKVYELVSSSFPSVRVIADLKEYNGLIKEGPITFPFDATAEEVHQVLSDLFPRVMKYLELRHGAHDAEDNPLYFLLIKSYKEVAIERQRNITGAAIRKLLEGKKGANLQVNFG